MAKSDSGLSFVEFNKMHIKIQYLFSIIIVYKYKNVFVDIIVVNINKINIEEINIVKC